MAAVFITNALLSQWSDAGKARLEGTVLTLVHEARTVHLRPAVRFTRLVDGAPDANSLIGKVKTREQLAEMGAEHYLDSVILGDAAYHVVEGFLGEVSVAPRSSPVAGPESGGSSSEQEPSPESSPARPSQAPGDVSRGHASTGQPTSTARSADASSSNDVDADPLHEAEALSLLFLSTVRD